MNHDFLRCHACILVEPTTKAWTKKPQPYLYIRLEGVSTYAIEFVEQDERATTFWGIIFPPNTSNA